MAKCFDIQVIGKDGKTQERTLGFNEPGKRIKMQDEIASKKIAK